MDQTNIKADTAGWDSLWAMEPTALRNAFAGVSADAKPTNQPKPQNTPYAVSNGTAIVPIVGPICKYPSILDALCGGAATLAVQSSIQKAITDPSVTQIVLFIDSPGGTVSGTSDLADYISAAKAVKPITAYVSDHCFSAAYWIASRCTRIVANEGAFIGSIGCYEVLTDSSVAAEKAGITVTLVSAGEYKGLDTPGLPSDPKKIDEHKQRVDAAYGLFVNSVAKGRSLATNVAKQLADGRTHIAADALKLKLIDAIGTIDVAMQVQEESNNMKDKQAKADAPVAAPDDTATPDIAEVLKQIQATLSQILEKVSTDDDEDSDSETDAPTEDGTPDVASDDDMSKAKAKEVSRLKAISAACGTRADFAIQQFIAGASAVEAKAALSDILLTENANLSKQVAKKSEGIEPLALGGSTAVEANANDPETLWAKNVGDVQKSYSGRKDYFLAALKHNTKKLNATAGAI